MSWEDRFLKLLEEKKGTKLSSGMVSHYKKMAGENIFHTCSECDLAIGKYPGRNARYCPNCGSDMSTQESYPKKNPECKKPSKPVLAEIPTLRERVDFYLQLEDICSEVHCGKAMVPWSPNNRVVYVADIGEKDVTFGVCAPFEESFNSVVGCFSLPSDGVTVEDVSAEVERILKGLMERQEQMTPLPKELGEVHPSFGGMMGASPMMSYKGLVLKKREEKEDEDEDDEKEVEEAYSSTEAGRKALEDLWKKGRKITDASRQVTGKQVTIACKKHEAYERDIIRMPWLFGEHWEVEKSSYGDKYIITDYRKTKKEVKEGSGDGQIEKDTVVGKRYSSAVAVIIKDESDILLGKVNPNTADDDRGDYWCLPGGGIDEEDGGCPHKAAMREAFEETGLTVESTGHVIDHPERPGVAFVCCRYSNGTVTPNTEFLTFQWLPYAARHSFEGIYPVNLAVMEQIPPGLLKERGEGVTETLGDELFDMTRKEYLQNFKVLGKDWADDKMKTAFNEKERGNLHNATYNAMSSAYKESFGHYPSIVPKGFYEQVDEEVVPAKQKDVDPFEFRVGVQVEFEHTTDREGSEKITLQHLAEDPKYYWRMYKAGLATKEELGDNLWDACREKWGEPNVIEVTTYDFLRGLEKQISEKLGDKPKKPGSPPEAPKKPKDGNDLKPKAPDGGAMKEPNKQRMVEPEKEPALSQPGSKKDEPALSPPGEAPKNSPAVKVADPVKGGATDAANGDKDKGDAKQKPQPKPQQANQVQPPQNQQPQQAQNQQQQPGQQPPPGQQAAPGMQMAPSVGQTIDMVLGDAKRAQQAFEWLMALGIHSYIENTTVRVQTSGPAEMNVVQRVATAFGLELSGLNTPPVGPAPPVSNGASPSPVQENKKPSKSTLDKAVKVFRLWQGSLDYASVPQQQKLYNKAMSVADKIAKDYGMDSNDVVSQLLKQAEKLGKIRPIPGKDM